MSRFVLLSTAAGSGLAADDARLASLAVLLRRRARTPLVAIVPDPSRMLATHPDLRCIGDRDLPEALAQAELLCVSAHFAGRRERIERAAHHAAMACLAGVPAALIAADAAAADMASPAFAHLAGVESVSAADRDSASALAAARGRGVETTAPPELAVETETLPPALRRGRVALDAACIDALDVRAMEALRTALRAFAPRAVVVLGESRRAVALGGAAPTESVHGGWPEWGRALARCQIVVTAGAAGVTAAALARGVVPVTTGQVPALLARVALPDCAVTTSDDCAAWARALAAAARAEPSLRPRLAPLRALAWRSLGALADAARARVPDAQTIAAGRALFGPACAALAAPALAAGDGARAERILDAWAPSLGVDADWAQARARADALSGRDADGVRRLEEAAAAAPGDAGLQAALARAWFRCGDVHAAGAVWRRSAELEPHAPQPWAELAQLALAGGRVGDALDALAEALARDPGHTPSVRTVRGLLASEPARESEFWRRVAATRGDAAPFAALLQDALERTGRAGVDPEPAAVAAGPAPEV